MNMFTVAALLACVAFSAAQLGDTTGSAGGPAGTATDPLANGGSMSTGTDPLAIGGSMSTGTDPLANGGSMSTGTGPLANGGLLGAATSPLANGGLLGAATSALANGGLLGAAAGPFANGGPLGNALNSVGTSTSTATTTSNNATPNPGLNQIFRNQLMTYGLITGENMKRTFMLPFLSRLGGSNAANFYYLNGGMEKYTKARMSDMISGMIARSLRVNPLIADMFAAQMTDAPDNLPLSNALLNRGGLFGAMGGNNGGLFGGMGGGNGGSNGAQGTGSMPMGAAFPSQQGGMTNSLAAMSPLLASVSMM